MSLPCVRGGAARSAAEGLYLTQIIFFFSVLQSLSFYNPSGAVAPAPFTQGSLFLFCANIAGIYLAPRKGDHWSPFLRKSKLRRGHSICPRCVGFHPNNRRREQAPALRGTKRKFQTAGGVSPPGGGVCAPLHMAHLSFVRGAGFLLLARRQSSVSAGYADAFAAKGFLLYASPKTRKAYHRFFDIFSKSAFLQRNFSQTS